MSVELHLPDLPEVPMTIGASPGDRRRHRPWHQVMQEAFSAYLPLLLMALLALGTWWLVNNTPSSAPSAGGDKVRLEPDYSMSRFTVQRFAPNGSLRVRLVGNELRHYPADDRIEVDSVQIHAVSPDGRVTLATARRAVGNGAASELQLQGGAEVTSTDASGAAVVIRSEFLHAFLDQGLVRTDLPVQVVQGPNTLSAAGLVYDHERHVLELRGPMRATLQVPKK